MCGCEATFTCSRCRGTRFDPAYEDIPDDREQREIDLYEQSRRSPEDEKQ